MSEDSAPMSEDSAPLGPADYARRCVECLVCGRPAPPPPDLSFFERPSACFVSLKESGQLRGCIGTLEPAELSLGAEIARNAYSAAFHDPRFARVRPDELHLLTCSVDVLSESESCELDDLDPALYGVIVCAGGRRGVLLPDLAGVDTGEQQVGIALQKAGIFAGEPYEVARFTVSRYHEGDPARDDPWT